jgi:hypothetical protein
MSDPITVIFDGGDEQLAWVQSPADYATLKVRYTVPFQRGRAIEGFMGEDFFNGHKLRIATPEHWGRLCLLEGSHRIHSATF